MITFHCLECDEDLAIDDAVALGQKISCIYCGSEFEVVAVDPIEVDWADEEEDQELAPLLDDEADLLNDDLAVDLEDEDDIVAPQGITPPTARTSGKTARKQRAHDELDDDLAGVIPELEDEELEEEELDDDEIDDEELDDEELDDEELDEDWDDEDEELGDDDDEWEWDLDDEEDRWS